MEPTTENSTDANASDAVVAMDCAFAAMDIAAHEVRHAQELTPIQQRAFYNEVCAMRQRLQTLGGLVIAAHGIRMAMVAAGVQGVVL